MSLKYFIKPFFILLLSGVLLPCYAYLKNQSNITKYSQDSSKNPYNTSFSPEHWMVDLAANIKNKKIGEIFIPGAHDAATSKISFKSSVIGDDLPKNLNVLKFIGAGFVVNSIIAKWSKAQDKSISNLLKSGVRYFDLRIAPKKISSLPFKKKFEYWTFHGLSGEPFIEVLKQIKDFMNKKENKNEIILIDLQNIVGKINSKIYQMITSILDERCLGNKNDLEDKTIAKLWKSKVRVFIFSKDTQLLNNDSKIKNPEKIIERSLGLTSYWPNADHEKKYEEKMISHYHEDYNKQTPVVVVQAQLTPSDRIIKSSLKPFSKSPKNLKEFWKKWEPVFFKKYFPHFVERTEGAVIMTDFMNEDLASEIIQENIK